MRPETQWRDVALLLAVLAVPVHAAAQTEADPSGRATAAYAAAPVLEVPFVPQSPALCGGAAVAMVLRYWGMRGIHAEEFAPLVVDDGIRTDILADAVRQRGWQALPFAGTAPVVREQLARGRPVIALIEVRPGRFHYVVLVGWSDGRIRLHDPARGPSRELTESSFERAWQASGRWTMLVLPGAHPSATATVATGVSADAVGAESCAATLERAALAARTDRLDDAERLLEAAEVRCSDRAAVTLEQAGLRFRQGRYADAATLATATLTLEPEQRHGWDVLASSRYLLGDFDGALRAWNRIGRPHNDLTRIEGLGHTRFDVVSHALAIAPGTLVSESRLARARRRVAALPALTRARVDYRPVPGGDVEVHAAIAERPRLPITRLDLLAHGVRALADERVRVEVAGPSGAGELWRLEWTWPRYRRALELTLAAPGAFGLAGVWELSVGERTLTYRERAADPAANGMDVREVQRSARIGVADWASGALHWQLTASADEWQDGGRFAGAGGAVDVRGFGDRGALRIALRGALRVADSALGPDEALPAVRAAVGSAWGTLQLDVAGRSAAGPALEWDAHAGAVLAADAPRTLWAAAGTHAGARARLRAHPLFSSDGIVTSPFFGPRLLHGSLEARRWLLRAGPAQLGFGAFVDGVAVPAYDDSPGRNALDVGVGLRIRAPGQPGRIELDAAAGLADRATALSLRWSSAWPAW